MKKFINIIGIALAAAFAVSCSVEYALVPTVRVEGRVIRYKKHRPAPPPAPMPPVYTIPGVPPVTHNTTVIIANNNPKPAPAPKVAPNPKPRANATPAKPQAKVNPAKPENQPRAQVQSGRQVSPDGNVTSKPQSRTGTAAQNAPSTRSSAAAAANSSRGR